MAKTNPLPTAATGSPHSQTTPGSPVTDSASSTATVGNAAVKMPPTHHSPGEQSAAATPPTTDQVAKGVRVYVCVCSPICVCMLKT